jgi:Phosphodiester glycosidase
MQVHMTRASGVGPAPTMRRTPPPLAALLSILLALGAVATAQPGLSPPGSQPYEGITLIQRVENQPRPVRLHVAQVDTRAPGIRFLVSPPAGARETVRQTTRAFLESTGAQLAINAHFFLPFPSIDADAWVIGLAASEGRVFSAFETPEQRYALVAAAPAINIDPRNRASIVHHDAGRPDGMHVREGVRIGNAVSGSAQIVTSGRASVPRYRDATHPAGLLTPGGPSDYSNEKAWADVVTARTAIGVSRDRRVLTLFTVDRAAGSEGMRLDEVATLLVRDYAVWDALNLDGGGSTTMAWQHPVTGIAELLNVSADSPGGRAVATSLAVFARRR